MIFCNVLAKLDGDEDAIKALARAVDHLQLPTELDPDMHKAQQIELLGELANGLRQLGRVAEADEALARAADLESRFPD